MTDPVPGRVSEQLKDDAYDPVERSLRGWLDPFFDFSTTNLLLVECHRANDRILMPLDRRIDTVGFVIAAAIQDQLGQGPVDRFAWDRGW